QEDSRLHAMSPLEESRESRLIVKALPRSARRFARGAEEQGKPYFFRDLGSSPVTSVVAHFSIMKQVISSPDAPKAIGPYSPAMRSGQLLFVSGQDALDPATGQMIAGDI